ncbi:MAG: hypothetical protein K8R74_15235 [Bacteroidales bacterium]|nr:hypothetical protein [Bacteroidales bacterium]
MLKTIIFKQLILFTIFIYSCESPNKSQPLTESFLGQAVPGLIPIRFAGDIITDSFYPHSKMIMSPEKDRIYWTTFLDTVSSDKALYYSDFDGENLSIAKTDNSLTKYGILSFTFNNDENNILYGSLQPHDELGGRLVRAVWKSEKADSGWSKPQPILSTLDTNWASLGSVSVNNAGDIYFVGRMEGVTAKIYCAKFEDGIYQQYEPLPENINTGITLDPFIDFQDRYLLFAAAGRNDNIGIIDLYISYKDENNDWREPNNLGQGISTQYLDRFPMVTSNGKYLFFVTSHADHFPSTYTHFYWVDAQVIENL